MPTPLTRGRPYYATFSATDLAPIENGTLSINIGSKYSFIPGNTVIIYNSINALLRFEAIVQSYDMGSGDMELYQITNIKQGAGGSWPQMGSKTYVISLAGQRGSIISSSTGAPSSTSGRVGDMYIDSTTGSVYIKS